MSSSMNQIASDLYKSLTESNNRKPKPYDTKAEVLREEGNIVWVKIPGGIDETPVQKTNNAKAGDTVMVRVSGGRAWLLGNNTSPATDDTRANQAYQVGSDAGAVAEIAIQNASRAQEAANLAEAEAGRATDAADVAQTSANNAQTSADSAAQSANMALSNLGIIENVVGVLNLLAEHGTYEVTTDDEVTPDKWYFERIASKYFETTDTEIDTHKEYYTRSGTGISSFVLTEDESIVEGKQYYTRSGDGTEESPYEYTLVEEPVAEDLGIYYEDITDPYVYTVVTNPTVGEIDTYYEAEYRYEVVNDPTSVYHLTEDTAIDPTKTYYTRTGTGGIIYVLTEDEAIVEGKTYYTRSGSGTTEDPYVYTEVEEPTAEDLATYYEAVDDPYVYTEVTNPDVADIGTYYEKYYGLVSVDDAVRNYVSSHLVLSGNSLFLQTTGTGAMLELNTDNGVILYGVDGQPRAQYGDDAIIGNPTAFHIKIDGTNNEIGFYQGEETASNNNKVAYMNSSALYVANSLSFGSFIFYERENGHFTLKKID